MSIALVRWLASLALGLALVIWAVEGQKNAYQLAFGLAVYGALCYQHGWKIDHRRGMSGRFIGFYVLPFAIAATVIAIQIVNRASL
jgi:uncharacterized RDD family membrane protein YckC